MQLLRWSETEEHWERIPCTAKGISFCLRDDGSLELREGADDRAVASLVAYDEHGAHSAVLVSRPGVATVYVGGSHPLGVTVLEDRAELLALGERLHFSAHRPLEVEPYAGSSASSCARCGDPLAIGDAVAICSGCGATHHEGTRSVGDTRACLSYDGGVCAGCQRSRSDFEWSPEGRGDA